MSLAGRSYVYRRVPIPCLMSGRGWGPGGPVQWGPMHHGQWSHGNPPIPPQNDRQTPVKTISSPNFVGGWWQRGLHVTMIQFSFNADENHARWSVDTDLWSFVSKAMFNVVRDSNRYLQNRTTAKIRKFLGKGNDQFIFFQSSSLNVTVL